MLGYLLWLLAGVVVGLWAAPTVSDAKARLLRRLHDLDAVASSRHDEPTDRGSGRR